MREKFAEADLLALIEGDLEPDKAADLRRRLAGDRKMLALVERLRDDREMLRTMDEPPLPADLLSELEPMMARPMLMPDSGDWRRRYGTRRPWRRYVAVAAVVCMALLAGVWAVTSGVLDTGGTAPDSMLAMQDAATPTTELVIAESTGEPAETVAWPPAGATIHHRGPLDATVSRDPEPRRERRARGVPPAMTTVEFVLVVDAGDGGQQGVQDTLRRVLGGLDGDVALVRNFSLQEAEQLARRLETEEGRRIDRELARAREAFAGTTADVGSGDSMRQRRRAASRMARTAEQSGVELGGELAVSGQLVGPRSLAPTYEQQIDYAESGATWTITVPADRLNDVLAGLQLDEGRETVLQTRPDGASSADRWLTDYPRILREAAGLDGNVMLPVRIAD